MDIRPAESLEDIAAVRELWIEYWQSFGLPLHFQGFSAELDTLPGVYSPPSGILLLALVDSAPAGTIALRPLGPSTGELKRLFLRQKYRGFGLGKALLEAVFDHSRTAGYHFLCADTLPVMSEALNLYFRYGFERTEPYSASPTPGAIYLKRKLD